jgi:hypothetical protein
VGPCLCGDTECPSCGPLQGNGGAPYDGGQAFPTPGDELVGRTDGMTLRDYFAAHAPDMPAWYDAANPPTRYPRAMPEVDRPHDFVEWDEGDDGAGRVTRLSLVARWRSPEPAGGRVAWNLPQSLAAYQAQFEAWRAARDRWDRAEAGRRYFAWRYAYADGMLEARGDA